MRSAILNSIRKHHHLQVRTFCIVKERKQESRGRKDTKHAPVDYFLLSFVALLVFPLDMTSLDPSFLSDTLLPFCVIQAEFF